MRPWRCLATRGRRGATFSRRPRPSPPPARLTRNTLGLATEPPSTAGRRAADQSAPRRLAYSPYLAPTLRALSDSRTRRCVHCDLFLFNLTYNSAINHWNHRHGRRRIPGCFQRPLSYLWGKVCNTSHFHYLISRFTHSLGLYFDFS